MARSLRPLAALAHDAGLRLGVAVDRGDSPRRPVPA